MVTLAVKMARKRRRNNKRIIHLSALFDKLTVVERCKICEQFEHTETCPFGDPGVNFRKHPDDYVSQVDLYLDKEKRKCRMIIAMGSEVSVLKMKAVPPHVPIINDDKIQLKSKFGRDISHLGKIHITVFDYPMVFYVVSDDIGIRSDGAIGLDFFSAAPAQWVDDILKIKEKKYPVIHFYRDSISIPPSSCVTDYVNVLTCGLQRGYLSQMIFGYGIFAGDCVVSVEDKKAYLFIFNYTKYKIEIPRPCVELKFVRSVNKFSYCVDKDSTIKLTDNLLCGESNWEGIFEFISKGRVNKAMELLRLDHLDEEELKAVKRWIENYNDILHLPRDKLNVSYDVMHTINSEDNVPVKCKHFSLSKEEKVEMKKLIDELFYRGIIKTSKSPYDSPAYVTPYQTDSQGNKKWKLIVDYSKLNEKTKGDAYPIPYIQDILDSLGGSRYFSVLKLASGYHQIQMNPDDALKTAFSTPDGHFVFKRMPAGLKNAPATFQRHLDKVLYELRDSVHCYLGSIIVYSKNLKNHEEILTRLATKFTEVNLKLQPDQCEFFRKEVVYLGYKISKDGVRPDPEKLKIIRNFPCPQNQSDIREFLGLTNFYKRFIEDYAETAKFLSSLLKAKEPFVWTKIRKVAFKQLKDELCSEPLLAYPNFNEPFTVTVESSDFTIGGTLTQGKPHKRRIIAHASRILSHGERKYEIHEQDILAIVYCIQQFHVYVVDETFYLVAEEDAFDWLDAVEANEVQNSRISKWASKIADYDYKEMHKL